MNVARDQLRSFIERIERLEEDRAGLNAAFIGMAMGAGLTSAITNPMVEGLMQAIRGADVIMNHDPQCTNWITAYREPPKDGAGGGRRRRRSART